MGSEIHCMGSITFIKKEWFREEKNKKERNEDIILSPYDLIKKNHRKL
ncbi:hypothetical protein V6B05_09525 [Lactococcus garvieae]